MAEYAINGDIATLLGDDHVTGDPAALWVEASQPVILDGTTGRLGGKIRVPLASDGTFTLTGLPETVGGATPLYRLSVDSRSLRRTGTSNGYTTKWFPLTANRDLTWIVANYIDIIGITPTVAANVAAAAALGTTNDTATASFVNNGASATRTALATNFAAKSTQTTVEAGRLRGYDPRGIDPALPLNGTGDQGPTLRAQIAAGHVTLPDGLIRVVGDLVIDVDDTSFRGLGASSHINVHNGAVILRGSATNINLLYPSIGNFSVTRTGTAGPAVKITGTGTGSGTARFDVNNITVRESTGAGFHIEGSYIGDLYSCKAYNSATGLVITTLDGIGGNALNFYGGEFQGCAKAFMLDTTGGVNFWGTVIEGNITGGELGTLCRQVGFWGCYWESNGGSQDILVGNALNPGFGLTISGGFWFNGTAKTTAIKLVRGTEVTIEGIRFIGYSTPIVVAEASAGAVSGIARNCASTTPGAQIVTLGTCLTFSDESGRDTGTRRITPVNGWTSGPGFTLSRTGNRVEWATEVLNGSGRTAAKLLDIPVGFRPRGLDLTVQPILDGVSGVWKQLSIKPTQLDCDSTSTVLYGRGSWMTDDPWPATLPGTAQP